MKNKKQLTFWGVIARDIWFIFRTVFWGIPKAIITQLRNVDAVSARNWLSVDSDTNGSTCAFFVYAGMLIVSLIIGNAILSSIPVCISVILMLTFPSALLGISLRYLWYRASLQEEEERVLKHNLEYMELCDDELTEDFYNTVSGSGG